MIAVIGAGAAGLAAAWHLARAGEAVTLYEASARAGGLMRTETVNGAYIDVGVQLIGSTYTALRELVRDLGAVELLRRSPGRDALWRRDRAHAITYGSVSSMALSQALPTTLKLRLAAKYLPYLTVQAKHLDANDLTGSGGAAFDGESIGSWGNREVGEDFVELLTYPLLAAYYGATPEETSAAVYHALARVGLDVSVYACAGGFGALADAIVAGLKAAGVQCTFNARVDSVHVDGDAIEVEAGGTRARHDGVVVALPANRALALLSADGGLRDWLNAVRERSTLTVSYRTDRPFPGEYFGLSFPRVAGPGDHLAALCIQSRKLPGLVPAGGDALLAMPAPTVVRDLWERTDDDVATLMLAAIEEAVSGVSRRVTATQVHRFEDGATIFTPGHVRRLTSFNAAWLPPNVSLAGDYLVAPTVEGAVRSGRTAAQRLFAARPRG
jgi:oxygen-dependent protoporphyrinogen oxidase